jgi:transposase
MSFPRQAAQIEALMKRVEDLEAKLGKPPKTPDNSSMPPSQGQKPNRAERRAAKTRKGHPGVFRALSENPDRVVETRAESCPHCEHALSAADQPEFHAYDHIEVPPIKPVVIRIHRHRSTCPCCRRGLSAPAPEGMAPGSPFGRAWRRCSCIYVTQAIGFERLVRLMDEVFGVSLSEGAIANMLARAEAPMIVAAEKIAAEVRASKVVASDETSARVKGKTWWQWCSCRRRRSIM